MPRACSISAAVSPPMPPPEIMTFMVARDRMSDFGFQKTISDYPASDFRFRHPISMLLRLDAGLADYVAPALRLFFDEGARLGRRAATRADAQRGKALAQASIAHRGIGGAIELGDDRGRRFWRRADSVPGIGNAVVDADLFQCRNIRQRRHTVLHGNGENARLSGFVQFDRGGKFVEHQIDIA